MIPENLREQWELVQARAEVLFLVDGIVSRSPSERRRRK